MSQLAKEELRVAQKEGVGNRGPEFWAEAVKRMNARENVVTLVEELGVKSAASISLACQAGAQGEGPATAERSGAGAREVRRLKQALADKVLEGDFLRGALHKVEERRRGKQSDGAKASTTRSGK